LGGTTYANTRIVVMTSPDDAAAMQVALAGRGADIAVEPAPEGALRLDRAAVAQREAVSAQAIAGVWIEQEPGTAEVCVVSSDGHVFRHAPLPVDAASPRVFAAIATSLLDEVLLPAGPNVNVDVNVNYGGPPPAGTMVAAPGAMPPSVVAIDDDSLPMRANRTLFEIGPMLTPVSGGVEVGVSFPLGPQWRVAVNGIANQLFVDTHDQLYAADLELRHIGLGRRHLDVGVAGGAATAEGDGVMVAMLRLGMTWEGPDHGVNLSLVPAIVFTGDPYTPIAPGLFASLRWEVPL
jgi:hypothetical protein